MFTAEQMFQACAASFVCGGLFVMYLQSNGSKKDVFFNKPQLPSVTQNNFQPSPTAMPMRDHQAKGRVNRGTSAEVARVDDIGLFGALFGAGAVRQNRDQELNVNRRYCPETKNLVEENYNLKFGRKYE